MISNMPALSSLLDEFSEKSSSIPVLVRSYSEVPMIRHDAKRKYIQRNNL
ncbi:MAG: hypothetical protein NUV81_03705 [bacterium]|nr:hypothetical protein [bacterium]